MMTRSSRWFRVGLLTWLFCYAQASSVLAQYPSPSELANPDLQNAPTLLASTLPLIDSVSAQTLATVSGPSGGLIFVKRAGNISGPSSVSYSLTGSALNGLDYEKLPGIIPIPAGASTAGILIQPIAQPGIMTNRTMVLKLEAGSSYYLDPYQYKQAEVIIRYQDPVANHPPTVTLAVNWMWPAGLSFKATASDSDGWVKKVEFFDGTSPLGEVDQAEPAPVPQVFSFAWGEARPGNYYVTARATDNLGASTTSEVVRITVPDVRTNAMIAITSPTNGATFVAPADIMIQATAVDPDGFIYRMDFYDNGTKIGSSVIETLIAPPHGTPAYHGFALKNAAVGFHTLLATAKFASGATPYSEPSAQVTVTKNPLTVAITSPTSNATFTTPTDITIVATAESAGVPAQSVQFFAGTKSLGIVTNNPVYSTPQPFRLTWSNAPVGTQVLTAKATDYQGFSVTSAPVNITVLETNPPILRVVATDPYASDAVTNTGGVTIIDSGMFTIYRSGNTNKAVTPVFRMTGTATSGYDYESLNYTVTIPAGVLSTNLVVKPINRLTYSRDSFVTLYLWPSSLYTLGSPTSAVVFIEKKVGLPPSVQIRQPLNGITVAPYFGNITIEVYANDSDGWVQQVEVKAGTNRIGVATNDFTGPIVQSSFRMIWTNPPPDVYSLTAIATDNRGITTISAPVQITVTSRTNYLAITSPANNDRIAAQHNLTVTATAADPEGYINLVEFYDGPNKIGQASLVSTNQPRSGVPYHYTFIWTNVPAGPHTLIAKAKDHAGTAIVSDPVQITAYVPESQLTINSPTNGASFTAPADIKIEATAIDPDGFLNYVEFYAGQIRIGESILVFSGVGGFPDPGTPLHHSFTWTNVDLGAYSLTAKSVNKAGNTVVSPPVTIHVTTSVSISYVERTLPESYQPGVPLTVHLKAAPPKTTSAYLIEDQPPEGWTVREVSHSGVYDAVNHKVKFGLFFDAEPRDLTYQVTPSATESGPKDFIGLCSIDGVGTVISGQSRISEGNAPNHPADNNPADFVMSANEVTAYSDAWRRGTTWAIGPNPIPASYVTRAGALWKGGEKYAYAIGEPPPLCWINLKVVQPQSVIALTALGVNPGTASCEMPAQVVPGTAFGVAIRFKSAPGGLAFAVEDQPPAGWAVAKVSDAGVVDPVIGKVKWGPFYAETERTLYYEVTPPPTASGRYAFAGTASCDGKDMTIIGQRQAVANISGVVATLKSVMRLANGHVQLNFAGDAGRSYLIETTTNLVDWTSLGTGTGTGDTWQFTDASAANLGRRFYRAVPAP